jgi:NAD(P)H-flavin reductase
MSDDINHLCVPLEAEILERIQESPGLYTRRLRFTDPIVQDQYEFEPGQFNMLYLYGVGEVAISIVSDPRDSHIVDHTIRIVGRVTQGIANLKAGDHGSRPTALALPRLYS